MQHRVHGNERYQRLSVPTKESQLYEKEAEIKQLSDPMFVQVVRGTFYKLQEEEEESWQFC